MSKKEFIKLLRELQKLQVSVIDSDDNRRTIDIYTSSHSSDIKPIYCISFYLFIYESNNNDIKELYSKTLYSNETITFNCKILNEIKKKVQEMSPLYGGEKRSEAERSDAPIE